MPPAKRKMFSYSEAQMIAAVEDVRTGVPVATAAKRHNVPRITLLYKSKGTTPPYRRMGPSSILTNAEEGVLVNWIAAVANAGFKISKDELLDSVQHIVRELKRKNPFTDNRPGRSWYNGFLKRNPDIGTRVARNSTSTRALVSQESTLRWFAEMYSYLRGNGSEEILNDPSRVFNADETAFYLNSRGSKVLAGKGEKSVDHQVTSDEKECAMVLITGSASGELAPPMVVFKYERLPQDIVNGIPKYWGVGKSESGWMTGALFYEFLTNVFHPWLVRENVMFPVILFVDGHAPRLTLHTSRFCHENGVILAALYPNSAHLVRPMDAVLRTLKANLKKKVHRWRFRQFKKRDFAPALHEVLDENVTLGVLQEGFRKCGLVPWDPQALDLTKLPSDSNAAEPDANTHDTHEIRLNLGFLEQYIDAEKLRAFKAASGDWTGDPTDLSLFKVWKEMNRISALVPERSLEGREVETAIEEGRRVAEEEFEVGLRHISIKRSISVELEENAEDMSQMEDVKDFQFIINTVNMDNLPDMSNTCIEETTILWPDTMEESAMRVKKE